ncbi:MAG: sterol desaturase/sphingolipid hydroxylase (fatty acid hydroxylase superfamily) [Paraglaciecola sp.]|jgi:sterol desaturase/sphingolipid hydroxylase (fatty acid hydroxylase superfamily)
MADKPMLDWPNEVIEVSYTVVLILAADLMRYFLHRLFHEIPLLRSFHKLHHTAEVMTPLTLYRSYPIEVMLSLLRNFLTIGLITGVFFMCSVSQLMQC